MNNRTILTIVEPLLASVTFIEQVNIWVKVLCGISTLVVAYFAVRSYISKKRLDDIQLKIDKQRLAKMEAEYLEKFKGNGI
jgi:hypothetical protein